MKRDFSGLSGDEFDLLVIGGGIYGAWIACDAAMRGLSVALVDQGDWGSGTSQSSSKLIHGGLRYLEHFKFGLVQRALAERRRLSVLAPHLVRPLRFALPCYKGDRVGKLKLEAGLWLYDRLAGENQPVPPHTSFSRREALEAYPFLRADGLRGGFTYGDCGTDDARFTLEVVAGAWAAGAVCVNHAEAVELIHENGKVAGAVISDRLAGGSAEVRAAVTVNAAGPWGTRVKGLSPAAQGMTRLVKGVHLVLPGLPTDDAFLLTTRRDGRVFFLIPWYGRTLVGTTDTDYTGDPGRVDVTPDDVEYLLTEAMNTVSGTGWTESDIFGAFAGVRTLRNDPDASATDLTREWSLEMPQERLLMPIGGKFTSSRTEAGITVERVVSLLGKNAGACPTKRERFPWAPEGPFDPWFKSARDRGEDVGLDRETAAGCARRYGTRVQGLHQLVADSPELARRIVPDLAFCMAEVIHAVKNETACTLDDILRRRMPLCILTSLDHKALSRVARLVEKELGWSDEQVQRAVKTFPGQYDRRP